MNQTQCRRLFSNSLSALAGVLSVLGCAFAAGAQVVITPLVAEHTATPGDFVTLGFNVKNTGPAADTFSFTVTIPPGLSILGDPSPLDLAPGEEDLVIFTVFVSVEAKAGENPVTLKATSVAHPTISHSASVRITVRQVPAVEVTAPPDSSQEPGLPFTLAFFVRNKGNALDRYELTVEVTPLFTVTISPRTLDLMPNERREVRLTLSTPKGSPPGRHRLVLTAQSLHFPEVQAQAAVLITILPPLPQDVGGTLFLEVPATLGNTISGALGTITISQLLAGGAAFGTASRVLFQLAAQDFTEIRTLFFELDREAYGYALGDMTVRATSLAGITGRGLRGSVKNLPLGATLTVATVVGTGLQEILITVSALVITAPSTLDIALGDTLRFTNAEESLANITLTSLAPGFGTQLLLPGQSFQFTFNAVGTFTVTVTSSNGLSTTITVRVIAGVVASTLCLVEAMCLFTGIHSKFSMIDSRAGLLLRALAASTALILNSQFVFSYQPELPAGHFSAESTVEAALSCVFTCTLGGGGVTDTAARWTASVRFSDFNVGAEVLRAGSAFLGDRRDELSFSLSQFFSRDAVAFNTLYAFERDNVNGALPTTTSSQLLFGALRVDLSSPTQPLPIVAVLARHRLDRTEPAPILENLILNLGLALTQHLQALGDLAFTGSIDRTTSRLTGVIVTDAESRRFISSLNLRLRPMTAFIRLTLSQRIDLLAGGAVIDQSLEALAGFRLFGPVGGIALSFARRQDRLELATRLNAQLGPFRSQLSATIGQTDAAPEADINFALSFGFRFEMPIVFVVTKGRVEGSVFVDTNGNGRRDPDEPGLEKLILLIKETKARTDATGVFRFPPLQPGEYALTLERLPSGFAVQTPWPVRFMLREGETKQIEIAVMRVALIEGVVFHDANQNGRLEEGEVGLPGVAVWLVGGGHTRETRTDESGAYIFSDLLPGNYILTIDLRTLPERFELTTPAEVPIKLEPQQPVRVDFGAFQKPKEVKFSPTAEFTFTPERPKVGEPVLFDASESFDPDGTIVKYEWDFDGDEQTDAEGLQVETFFKAAGKFKVTLTVTDNDGNTGTKTKTVTVSQ